MRQSRTTRFHKAFLYTTVLMFLLALVLSIWQTSAMGAAFIPSHPSHGMYLFLETVRAWAIWLFIISLILTIVFWNLRREERKADEAARLERREQGRAEWEERRRKEQESS